jgi:hypothetical protein
MIHQSSASSSIDGRRRILVSAAVMMEAMVNLGDDGR